MLDTLKSHYKNLSKFSVVGLVNTVIDFVIFYMLHEYFGVDFLISHICAFFIALINSFIFNAIWTFKNLKRDELFKQVSSFFVIGLIGLLFSSLILYVCAPYMHIMIAKILAMFVSLVWNYTGSWLFVFKD